MATPCDRLRWTTDGSRRLLVLMILALPSSAQELAGKEPEVLPAAPALDGPTSLLAGAVLVLGSIYLCWSRLLVHRVEMRKAELDLDKTRLNAAKDLANQLLKANPVHRDEDDDLGPSLATLVRTITKLDPPDHRTKPSKNKGPSA